MKFNTTQINNTGCLYLYDLFSFFSLFATAFGIAFSIVGSTMYTRVGEYDGFFDDMNSDDDEADDEEEEEEEEEEYDHLYYDELDKLEDRVLEKEDLEKLGKVVVREKTPNGEVIMTYNNKTEAFEYFCDDKNVKYMVLDTVARKFTIDNNCKSICVNYKAEFEKAKVAIMADQVTVTKTNTEGADASTVKLADVSDGSPAQLGAAQATAPEAVVKRSIYAKFKNYNTVQGNNNKKKELEKEKALGVDTSTTKTEKIYILTEKANRFTYKGRISNYKDPNTVEETNTVYKKTIDFATFKATVCNKTKDE